MAVATADLYCSFPIAEITKANSDGDFFVSGKATDGTLDHDSQIIHPEWAAKAIREWLDSGGNVRVQHNPSLYPAGVGVECWQDSDGGTWVKSLIVEENAKKLVKARALTAYSVGVSGARPERDTTGRARNGIIKSGRIIELSLVDRPANPSCGIQVVKSVNGRAEFIGKAFGNGEDPMHALLMADLRSNDPHARETAWNILYGKAAA